VKKAHKRVGDLGNQDVLRCGLDSTGSKQAKMGFVNTIMRVFQSEEVLNQLNNYELFKKRHTSQNYLLLAYIAAGWLN
jgi:hypothetical protein